MATKKHTAETIRVDHPEASYGIFCFNEVGDLFLNSDWGFYGYAWRAFGDDFREFLSSINAEYIVGKFAINYQNTSGKRLSPRAEKNLKILVTEFILALKVSEPLNQ